MLLFPTQYRQPFSDNFLTFIKSRAPLAHVETSEIQDLRNMIWNIRLVDKIQRSIFHYTLGGPLCCSYYLERSNASSEIEKQNFNKQSRNKECNVEEFIQRITTEPEIKDPSKTSIPKGSIIIATGITGVLEDSELCQRLIEAISNGFFVRNRIALILTDTILDMPPKLTKYSIPLQYSLPDHSCLYATFLDVVNSLEKELSLRHNKHKGGFFWYQCPAEIDKLLPATLGMTTTEAANIYRLCILDTKSPQTRATDFLPVVSKQKRLILQQSKALRLIPEEELPDVEDIGGLKDAINFLTLRAKAFTPEAEKLGIDLPRGVVFAGRTGTGKSTLAKAAGKILGLPVIALNMGEIYNAYVGVSESRIQQELNRIDAFNGCVLLIDEADKALAGGDSDSGTDGGVAMRVVGILLHWLQERKSRTFVIMTMNDTTKVPPELLRSGRFDRVFSFNVPTNTECKEIMQAHLRKRGVPELTLSDAEWDTIFPYIGVYTGADIEAIVIEARYRALNNRNSGIPTYEDIIKSIP